MVSEGQPYNKTRYQSYEQYRERFFGSKEKLKTKDNRDGDDTASFGKRLAREFARRDSGTAKK